MNYSGLPAFLLHFLINNPAFYKTNSTGKIPDRIFYAALVGAQKLVKQNLWEKQGLLERVSPSETKELEEP